MKENNKIVDVLKSNDLKKFLTTNFEDGFLYSEAEMQCLIYMHLRNSLPKEKYIYSEVNAWNYRADLVILDKNITDIRSNEENKIKNLAFNLAYYKKIRWTWIELKYCYSFSSIKKQLKYELKALNIDCDDKKYKINDWHIGLDKISLFIIDLSERKKNNLNEKDKQEIDELMGRFQYLGFIWNWEKILTIKNF